MTLQVLFSIEAFVLIGIGCLEVKNEKINFSENAMNFSAFGIQAQLPIQFVLNLAFYKDIIPEQSSWKLESVGTQKDVL